MEINFLLIAKKKFRENNSIYSQTWLWTDSIIHPYIIYFYRLSSIHFVIIYTALWSTNISANYNGVLLWLFFYVNKSRQVLYGNFLNIISIASCLSNRIAKCNKLFPFKSFVKQVSELDINWIPTFDIKLFFNK